MSQCGAVVSRWSHVVSYWGVIVIHYGPVVSKKALDASVGASGELERAPFGVSVGPLDTQWWVSLHQFSVPQMALYVSKI